MSNQWIPYPAAAPGAPCAVYKVMRPRTARTVAKGMISFHTATPELVTVQACEEFARRLESLSAPDCPLELQVAKSLSGQDVFTLNWSGIVYRPFSPSDRISVAVRYASDGVLRDFFQQGRLYLTNTGLLIPKWHFYTEIKLKASGEVQPQLEAVALILKRLRRVPLPFDTLYVEVNRDGAWFRGVDLSGWPLVGVDAAACGLLGNPTDPLWTDIASGFYKLTAEAPRVANQVPSKRWPRPELVYNALRQGSVREEDRAFGLAPDSAEILTESVEVPFRVVHSPVFMAPVYGPPSPLSALKADLLETRCPSCNAKYSGTHAHFYPCGCSVKITYAQEPWGVHLERIWVASSQDMHAKHPTREGAARALRELLGA